MSESKSQLPKAILLDMDGVLYHGNKALPYAVDFIHQLATIPHVYITNNPILLPEAIAEKLERLGFPKPSKEQIITSGIATAEYLSSQKKDFSFYALGAEGLHNALLRYGTESEIDADYVVVGEGEGIDFDKLTVATNLIVAKGAQLISTNPDASVDAVCEDKKTGKPIRCIVPGGGALVAPLVVATGVKPITIGKPFPLLYEMALARLGLTAEDCLMIGDRPDTDILGAQKLGMPTALVRTGRFEAGAKLPNGVRPDFDVEHLHALSVGLGFS